MDYRFGSVYLTEKLEAPSLKHRRIPSWSPSMSDSKRGLPRLLPSPKLLFSERTLLQRNSSKALGTHQSHLLQDVVPEPCGPVGFPIEALSPRTQSQQDSFKVSGTRRGLLGIAQVPEDGDLEDWELGYEGDEDEVGSESEYSEQSSESSIEVAMEPPSPVVIDLTMESDSEYESPKSQAMSIAASTPTPPAVTDPGPRPVHSCGTRLWPFNLQECICLLRC